MTKPWIRIVIAGTLVLALAVTALAQRGGFGRRNRSFVPTYSGNVPYDGKFVFVRMSYEGDRRNSWAHDYPTGEFNFMTIFSTITNAPSHVNESSIMSFSDPEMYKFPVIYLCEPGWWQLSQDDAVLLRDYLVKGGFMIVDDFPADHWAYFDLQMSRAFPDAEWIELDEDHQIFHSFFEVNPFEVIPPYSNLGGRPSFQALFEDNDPSKRMYVVANYQNDLSEWWEASSQGYNLVDASNEAYKIGVNEFIYAITH